MPGRKAIEMGEGTILVSLPKSWVRKNGIKKGDTLAFIANLFQTSVASLKSWNRMLGERIVPGQKLSVYTASRQPN